MLMRITRIVRDKKLVHVSHDAPSHAERVQAVNKARCERPPSGQQLFARRTYVYHRLQVDSTSGALGTARAPD